MAVTAIIPAYNEEDTLQGVLNIVRAVDSIGDIIVVSDGSTDDTVTVGRRAGVRLIEFAENRGKGAAMKAGLDSSETDVVLFLDADLVGLTTEHVEALLEPVISDRCEMCVGLFEGGRIATDLAQVMAPYLSGQRVIKTSVLESMDGLEISRFGVEVALTMYCKQHNIRTEEVPLPGLTHRMKEEKLGFSKGLWARLCMYWEIVKSVQKGR